MSPSAAERLAAFERRVLAAAQGAVAETAETLARLAAEGTPVRTGRLRDGWRVGAAPEAAEPEATAPPTLADQAEPSARRTGPRAYVVNAVPYALAVEVGTLGRPGQFMAARAVSLSQGSLAEALVRRLEAGAEEESASAAVEPEQGGER